MGSGYDDFRAGGLEFGLGGLGGCLVTYPSWEGTQLRTVFLSGSFLELCAGLWTRDFTLARTKEILISLERKRERERVAYYSVRLPTQRASGRHHPWTSHVWTCELNKNRTGCGSRHPRRRLLLCLRKTKQRIVSRPPWPPRWSPGRFLGCSNCCRWMKTA